MIITNVMKEARQISGGLVVTRFGLLEFIQLRQGDADGL
jgi:hypothetical protein